MKQFAWRKLSSCFSLLLLASGLANSLEPLSPDYKKVTPIAVFAYNRPSHLQLTLEALGKCSGYKECPIYIFCDAPKNNQNLMPVRATHAVADAWVELQGEGTVIKREGNQGYLNLTKGITEICNKYGRVIVVEDDILVSPDFLDYARKSLDRYENDSHVYMVSGFMYPDCQPDIPSTFFLPTAHIWGWATWKRAWDQYSLVPDGWEELMKDPEQSRRFDYDGTVPFSSLLQEAVTSNPPHAITWDVQWAFTIFKNHGLALYPSRSLVWNTGVAFGYHSGSKIPSLTGRDPRIHGNMEMEDFAKPRLPHDWSFPEKEEVNEEAYQNIVTHFKKQQESTSTNRSTRTWYQRILNKLSWW